MISVSLTDHLFHWQDPHCPTPESPPHHPRQLHPRQASGGLNGGWLNLHDFSQHG